MEELLYQRLATIINKRREVGVKALLSEDCALMPTQLFCVFQALPACIGKEPIKRRDWSQQ